MPVLAANGETINYVQEGSGPDIVLIHSLGSSVHMWREQIAALRDRCTIIALDLRGHGQSSGTGEISMAAGVQDLKAVLDHLGVAKCDLVGISTGVSIALMFNAKWPDMVRSLVLAGGVAQVAEGSADRVDATREAIAYISMREFGVQYAAEHLMPSTPLSIQDELADAIGKVSPKAYVQSMRSALLDDFTPLLPAVKAPTLVLVGEHDLVTPGKMTEFLVRNISGAVLDTIPAAGHLSSLDNPAAFNSALSRFLEANKKPA